MASRYDDRDTIINVHELYEEQRTNRGVSRITHYETAILRHPVVEDFARIKTVPKLWSVGDKFYKVAHQAYGDGRLWWVIAWFNKKPTEAHVKPGEIIKIPHPINEVLDILNV